MADRPLPEMEALRTMHPALRSRMLETFLKENGVREPEADHIALVEQLVFSNNPSAKADLPGGITVSRCYEKLVVLTEEQPTEAVELPMEGTVKLPRLGLKVTVAAAAEIINTPSVFTVCPEGEILLRFRQSGDAMRLSGGTKTLKKLMIDRKIPAARRQTLPVITDSRGILAVYDIGADIDRTAKQLPAVQIRIEPLERE